MEMKLLRSTVLLLLAAASLTAGAESLYREESFRALTADPRAYRPGDLLTILVVESSSATSSADTSTEKKAGIGLAVQATNLSKSATVDLNDNFSGKGTIQRSGKLLAQLTVTVKAVEPNGDLLVAGAQQIAVNDERQNILLEGRVRPVDISESNTVLSTRLADAKISYIGDGILGEKQHPGIISRILSWLGIL
jgi:flagellar L-ring protein precursor FlgH